MNRGTTLKAHQRVMIELCLDSCFSSSQSDLRLREPLLRQDWSSDSLNQSHFEQEQHPDWGAILLALAPRMSGRRFPPANSTNQLCAMPVTAARAKSGAI